MSINGLSTFAILLPPLAFFTISDDSPKERQPLVQQNPVSADDPMLLKVGNKIISSQEFLQIYKKNLMAGDTSSAERNIKDYLNLFVNFKLKVLAAEKLGLDTTTAFREELQTYRKQLSQSYLTEKNVSDNLVKEAYERLKEEISASNIVLKCLPDAPPQDTLRVYEEAMKLRERILGGEDFGKLAKMYSSDPSASTNEGNLDYFSALQMVYPFETMAYQTPKGKVSMPFRSKFGFHILKVNDRRDSKGKVKVAHIMVTIAQDANEKAKNDAKLKIDELFKKLQNGEKFEQVCKLFSEDETTKNSNGILEVFGAGVMLKEFEEAAFGLKEIGEISLPVRTKFGWHIIKLLEKKALEQFSDMQGILKQKIQADSRSNLGRVALIKRLKKDNKFSVNEEIVRQAISAIDTRVLKHNWDFDEKSLLLNKTIFVQGAEMKSYTVKDYWEYVKKRQKNVEGTNLTIFLQKWFDEFCDQEIIKFEDEALENHYPDFRYLMQEYRDGILSFEMMNNYVWQRAVSDTMGLKSYFMTNKGKYQMPERANAQIIMADSPIKLEEVKKILGQNPYPMGRKLNDLLYDKNQYELTEELKTRMFDALVVLKRNPDYQITIMGNIDPTEADSVSGLRIKSVVKYLENNAVKLNRIIEKDNGKFEPVSRTDRKLNQRIAFNFTSNLIKDVEKKFNAEKPESVSIQEGFFKKGDSKILDGVKWQPGASGFDKAGKFYQVKINRIEPPRGKSFFEARGSVINDFQNFLENQWINKLKNEYKIEINEEELNKLSK